MSKEQKLFHSTVTFHGLGEARIDNLTQEQAWQIQDVMRLIERQAPNYSARGVLLYSVKTETADKRAGVTVRPGFLARLMRRFNAWAVGGCVVIALLGAAAIAQDRKPRVSVAAQDGELARLLRDELTDSNVAVTTAKRGDYEMTAAIAPLGDDIGCRGVIGVLLIEGRDGRQLSAFIASDVGALARQLAQGFNKELQTLKGK